MADVKLPVRTVPRKPKLDSLPQEVHDLIFEHASSPQTQLKHHLWPLLFVSRQMYHAVLPSMYRRVSFEVDSSVGSYKANYKLLQLADKENQGLMHIDEVQLFPRDELTRKPSVAADYPDAIQLLAAIPRNQLRRFNWDSWHQMPPEVLRLLRKRQHKLTNIELVPCSKPLDERIVELDLGSNPFHQHATELRIADVGRGVLPAAALHILKERPQITTLTLDFRSIKCNLDNIGGDLFDDDGTPLNHLTKAYHEDLLKELFRPSKQLQRAVPLAVTTLHLHCVDLWYGPKYMSACFDWKVLETLHLVSCQRPDVLLTRMSQIPAERRPRLRKFHIYHEQHPWEVTWVSDDIRTDRTIYNVNEFLLSIKDTLVDLWIVMRGLRGQDRLLSPMAAGIANHGNSLLRLTADVRSCRPSHSAATGAQWVGWFNSETWEQVCASMAQLEQLYVPFPPVVADEYMTSGDEYHLYLDTALQIPTLKTLNMTTWPYPLHTRLYPPNDSHPLERVPYIEGPWKTERSTKGRYMPVDFYHLCLKYLVHNITRRRNELVFNPFKPLDIVGFGLLERNHYMSSLEDPLDPVYFWDPRRKGAHHGRFLIMEQWLFQDLERTRRGCELLSGVVDIDWLTRHPIKGKLLRD